MSSRIMYHNRGVFAQYHARVGVVVLTFVRKVPDVMLMVVLKTRDLESAPGRACGSDAQGATHSSIYDIMRLTPGW